MTAARRGERTTYPSLRATLRRACETSLAAIARERGVSKQAVHQHLRHYGAMRGGLVQRQILAAIRMHGPMKVREVWRQIEHDDPMYVARAMHRLHRRALLQRWGSVSHYTYDLPASTNG